MELQSWMTPNTANWIAGILSLFIFSFLYKENPFYRVAEHIYVGSSAAHTIITTWHNGLRPRFEVNMMQNGEWWMLLPCALGLMIYFNLYRPYAWLARMPMAFWIGYNAAVNVSTRIVIPMFNDIIASMKPLIAMPGGNFNFYITVQNIVFFVAITGTLVYFFFTVEHTGIIGVASRIGRYAIMLGLGASFGNTVAARVSLLIGRFAFIFGDWLHWI
ncbi:MAG: hypothetical protein FWE76_06420 [Symbiobacteriaceae bacterium]|nr:hypothetical protein [Symbiobacteriaceae bacterium]